jgi:hypothetical protein
MEGGGPAAIFRENHKNLIYARIFFKRRGDGRLGELTNAAPWGRGWLILQRFDVVDHFLFNPVFELRRIRCHRPENLITRNLYLNELHVLLKVEGDPFDPDILSHFPVPSLLVV